MSILRISRTYPSFENRNIGLQCHIFSKYSNKINYIFTKDEGHRYIKLKNCKLFKIKYSEISLNSNRNGYIKKILSTLTKIFANVKFLILILKKISINKEIDCIHIHNFNFLLTGVIIKILFKKKCFLSVGGTDIHLLKQKILFYFLISNIDIIFSVSNHHKKILKKIYPSSKIIVIENGVDLNFYKFKKKKKYKNFISIGNIRWQKDYLTALKAFSIFAKKNNDYKYFIIGKSLDKNQYSECKKFILNNDLSHRIFFLGYKNSQFIKKALYSSNALLLSSISEGLPKVILESISCGTPVISSNVGDNPRIIKNCGLIFKKKKYKQLAKLLFEISQNKNLMNEFQQNCEVKRNFYNWKLIYKKVKKYY